MKRGTVDTRRKREPARLVALVWLVAAMLAMPVVASAQLAAARMGGEGSASRGAAPESGAIDLPSARQAVRALPVAELRFLAERTDAKPLPAGPDPLMPSPGGWALCAGRPERPLRPAFEARVARPVSTPEARAPPAA